MINNEIKKRILTSTMLITLLILMYYYSYILIMSLIFISLISWIEFYGLIIKIFNKNNPNNKILRFFFKFLSLLYLSFFVLMIFMVKSQNSLNEIFIIYSMFVCINSDIGGLIFGKILKGKKLTKISPNKTISGSIGAFIFSLMLIPFYIKYFDNINVIIFVIITLLISFTSQIGDLIISFLKRKANVKNTGDLLPGHGGVLDRIDGILFGLPMGFILFSIF